MGQLVNDVVILHDAPGDSFIAGCIAGHYSLVAPRRASR